jgi:hypothetical protein
VEILLVVSMVIIGSLSCWLFDRDLNRAGQAALLGCLCLIIMYCLSTTYGWGYKVGRLQIFALISGTLGLQTHKTLRAECNCEDDLMFFIHPFQMRQHSLFEQLFATGILLGFLGITYAMEFGGSR